MNNSDPFGLCCFVHSPAVLKAVADASKQVKAPDLDVDATVKWMQENANAASTGRCARYCRLGLQAGGLDMTGNPVAAGDYGQFLEQLGFEEVSGTAYQKGDVAVFEKTETRKYGHIQIFDGRQWISDFKQENFSPYRKDVPAHTVYRYPQQK